MSGPFSIAAGAATVGELLTALDARNAESPQPVPDEILSQVKSIVYLLPEGAYTAQVSGLAQAIEPDPEKPGSGQRPYLRIEING